MNSNFVTYTVTESRLFLNAQALMPPINNSFLTWLFFNISKANNENVVIVNMTLGEL